MRRDRRDQVLRALSLRSRGTAEGSMSSLEWPERLSTGLWWTSPDLVSLAGTEVFESMPLDQQQALARHEAVNFFSLNIHGERLLAEGILRYLHREADPLRHAYLHHMLEEEIEHMATFSRFCERYHGGLYESRYVALPREQSPHEESLCFFAGILVFEERVDYYNRVNAADPRVDPLVREINRRHHEDEVRHLAFGRIIVRELVDEARTAADPGELERVRTYLRAFVSASRQEYTNPDVYRDAGLASPFAVRRLALTSAAMQAREARALRRLHRAVSPMGLLHEGDVHV
jgi:hypothetical protein